MVKASTTSKLPNLDSIRTSMASLAKACDMFAQSTIATADKLKDLIIITNDDLRTLNAKQW